MNSSAASHSRILTPDQRPRVFVSSTLQELAPERAATRAAIERLRLIPVMFELGARPHPARSLYRAYLAQSHVFVGLYFESYGWVAPEEEISGLEDEYRLSTGLPRLVYIKSPAPQRDQRLAELLDTVRSDDAVTYKSFGSPSELESLLTEDLAVLMSERFLLGRPADDDEPGGGPLLAPSRPLPTPVDSLVGRRNELDALEELLRTGHRLITVMGTGGIGKSRLALEAARRVPLEDERRVEFVPLDSVDDPARVLDAVASAIGLGRDGGVPALEALASAFSDRPVLLVLDNFEHVLAAASGVAELLSRCPNLVLLVTSRASLRVRGETLFTLGPLSLPAAEGSDHDSAAVALFVERARAVRPDFSLDDPATAQAVAELCRRLEGIPLAIELAAGRSRLLPPQALLDRLGSALDLGSGATDLPTRQRTLRDTMEWSEHLLTPDQQAMFAALSAFSAPWTLADAESVAPEGVDDALDAVAALVENSLVTSGATSPGEPRFRMFDMVRDYAGERMDAMGIRTSVEDAFYRGMIAQVADYLEGIWSKEQARWRAEFRLVWPDLRRAWVMALARRDGERAAAASYCVTALWLDGRNIEVEDLLTESLELGPETGLREHAELVLIAAQSALYLGHYEQSKEYLDRLGTDELPRPDRPLSLGVMHLLYGYIAAADSDLETSESRLKECADVLRDGAGSDARWVGAFAHNGLGSLMQLRGDLPSARREFMESQRLAEESGNISAHMQSLVFMASVALAENSLDEAKGLLLESLPLVDQQPFYEGNSYCLEVAAAFALVSGRPIIGARALGLARALRELNGAALWALHRTRSEMLHQAVRSAAGDEAFDTALEAGAQMDPRATGAVVRQAVAPS